jgi:cystathionine beta-lyase/cystathionine gamma-synthase
MWIGFDRIARAADEEPSYAYTRCGDPILTVCEMKLAELDHAEVAILMTSGVGAIASTLWFVMQAGDHVIMDHCMYEATLSLCALPPEVGYPSDVHGHSATAPDDGRPNFLDATHLLRDARKPDGENH